MWYSPAWYLTACTFSVDENQMRAQHGLFNGIAPHTYENFGLLFYSQ